MMNVRERIERIEALEAECYERFKALKAEVQQSDEFPQDGDEYHYIEASGRVERIQWDESGFDLRAQEIGNIYKTKEQAEFEVEKLKVLVELREFSVPFKHDGDNYTFNYNHKNGKIVNLYASEGYQDFGALYFESNEELNRAIKSVGEERIKKYIFGVED